MADQPIRQIDLKRHQTVRRGRRKHQQMQILPRHARRLVHARIQQYRLIGEAVRNGTRECMPQPAPKILANHRIAINHPSQLVRPRRHLTGQQQRHDGFKRLARLL